MATGCASPLGPHYQQLSKTRDLTAQHPRVGHGLEIRFQGLPGGVDRNQLQVATEGMEVVDGLLIGIRGMPEIMRSVHSFSARGSKGCRRAAGRLLPGADWPQCLLSPMRVPPWEAVRLPMGAV